MTRRRKILLASMVAYALLVSGFIVTTGSLMLEPGSRAYYGPDAVVKVGDGMTEVKVRLEPTKQVTFGVSLRNPGPWPVTIREIDPGHIFKLAHLTMIYPTDAPGQPYGPTAATEFKPTSVAAGEELVAYLTVTIPDVETAPGSGLYFSDLDITYTVLGVIRHEPVPMGFKLFFQTPGEGIA